MKLRSGWQPRDTREYRLQVAIVDYMDGVVKMGRNKIHIQKPFTDIFMYHCYQGRSEKEGFFLKQMGVKRGVSDLPWFGKGKFGFIEVKAPEGKLTGWQPGFKKRVEEEGGFFHIARCVTDVRDYFIQLGFECHNNNCIEPAPSKWEKMDLYTDYLKTTLED